MSDNFLFGTYIIFIHLMRPGFLETNEDPKCVCTYRFSGKQIFSNMRQGQVRKTPLMAFKEGRTIRHASVIANLKSLFVARRRGLTRIYCKLVCGRRANLMSLVSNLPGWLSPAIIVKFCELPVRITPSYGGRHSL